MRQVPLTQFVTHAISAILLCTLLLFGVASSAGADVNQGREAYAISDYHEALEHFREPAERGNSEAQLYLGLMYRGGEGVSVDHQQAVTWYRRAAEQGNARAQTNLAISYALGRGVDHDIQQALRWYLRAARQGYTDAQVRLGELYSGGQGIPADPIQAYAWYSMALRDEATCECIRGYRDEIAASISAGEMLKADNLVEQWTR